MFRDRQDAGQRLACALQGLTDEDVVIVDLPRGGVPVAAEVARRLKAPLDIRLPHKIGAPTNPEFAIGAVTEDGQLIYDEDLVTELGISPRQLIILKEQQLRRIQERAAQLRGQVKRQSLTARTVIIIDDGIATGATMEAAIRMARAEGTRRVTVAASVAQPGTLRRMRRLADDVVCVESHGRFVGVAGFYSDLRQVSDAQVVMLLDEAAQAGLSRKVRRNRGFKVEKIDREVIS